MLYQYVVQALKTMLNHDNEWIIKCFNHNHRNIPKIPSGIKLTSNNDMQIPFRSAEILLETLVSYHYSDVIVTTMSSQITGVSIVYSTVCSGADQRKSSKLSHWTKGQYRGKCYHLMTLSWRDPPLCVVALQKCNLTCIIILVKALYRYTFL